MAERANQTEGNSKNNEEINKILESVNIPRERSTTLSHSTPWFDDNFRSQILNQPLLYGSYFLMVWLDSASELPAADLIGTSDPYVIFTVEPKIPNFDDQTQKSTKIMRSLNPKWAPPQLFRFIILNPEEARLVINLMDWDHYTTDDLLGYVTLQVKLLINSNSEIQHSLHLVHPTTGNATNSLVGIRTLLVPLRQGLAYQEFYVFEYERWHNNQWGHTKDFFKKNDPNHWGPAHLSDNPSHGSSMEFDDIAPRVPNGWQITQPWSVSPFEGNSDGWQYSTNFTSQDWHRVNIASYVRRRIWKQVVQDPSVWN